MKTVTNQPETINSEVSKSLPVNPNLFPLLIEGMPYVHLHSKTKINYGGCAIFANLLTDELDRLNVPYQVVCCFEGRGDEDIIRGTREFISNPTPETAVNSGAGHVITRIMKLYAIDSEGFQVGRDEVEKVELEITKEQLQLMVKYSEQFGEIFDKGQIPEIKEDLHKVLSHLDDFHPGMFIIPNKEAKELNSSATEHTKREIERHSSPQSLLESILGSGSE